MQKWSLLFTYLFREIVSHNLFFTLISVALIYSYGERSFPYIFWVKIIGFSGTLLVYYWSRKKHLHFFHNLGSSVRSLIFIAFTMDTLIAVSFFFLAYLIA